MRPRQARPGLEDRGVELWARRTPRWQLAIAGVFAVALVTGASIIAGLILGGLLSELSR